MENKSDKFFLKIILFVGIVLWMIGAISNIVIGYNFLPEQFELPQYPILKKLMTLSPLYMLLLPIIISPIIEEFAFRFWTKQKLFSNIISFIAINIIVYSAFRNFIYSGIILLLIGYLFFILKNCKLKIVLIVFFTSLIFGLMHLSNYNSTWIKVGSVIQLCGLGIILCYIGLRFRFVFCLIAHSIINMIAILPLMFFINTKPIVFENTTYNAKLTEVSLFSLSNYQDNLNSDSILLNNHITEIATSLAPFQNNTIYIGNIEKLKKYKFIAIAKNDTLINPNQLFNDFLTYTKIQSDTLYKPAFILSISDSLKLHFQPQGGYYLTTLYGLIESIRKIYDIPLVMENEYDNYTLAMDLKFLKLKKYVDVKTFLKNKYGINIIESGKRYIAYVRFKEAK